MKHSVTVGVACVALAAAVSAGPRAAAWPYYSCPTYTVPTYGYTAPTYSYPSYTYYYPTYTYPAYAYPGYTYPTYTYSYAYPSYRYSYPTYRWHPTSRYPWSSRWSRPAPIRYGHAGGPRGHVSLGYQGRHWGGWIGFRW